MVGKWLVRYDLRSESMRLSLFRAIHKGDSLELGNSEGELGQSAALKIIKI